MSSRYNMYPIQMHECTCAHVYIYIYMRVFMNVCVCVCVKDNTTMEEPILMNGLNTGHNRSYLYV